MRVTRLGTSHIKRLFDELADPVEHFRLDEFIVWFFAMKHFPARRFSLNKFHEIWINSRPHERQNVKYNKRRLKEIFARLEVKQWLVVHEPANLPEPVFEVIWPFKVDISERGDS